MSPAIEFATFSNAEPHFHGPKFDLSLEQDGKVERWELEVFERIKSADEDKSGSINVKELFGVIRRAAESDRQKRLFRKLLVIACLGFVVMLCANMALTAAVVFLAKDTVVSADGALTTPAGEMVRVRCVAES